MADCSIAESEWYPNGIQVFGAAARKSLAPGPPGPTRLLTGSARMTDVANRALAGTVVSMLQINNLN